MKRIVASVGLVALGASSVEAASVSDVATSPLWPLKVSATLRGFYDDNVNSVPGSGDITLVDNSGNSVTYKRGSFGFEISPALELNWAANEQTALSLGYVYSFRYFDNKPLGNDEHFDQVHNFNLSLDHAFTERYRVKVTDSFVIGQEPDMLRTGYTFPTFQRVPGDNIRNYGSIVFSAQLTPLWGLEAGYANTFADYDHEGPTVAANGTDVVSSLSGALDRLEHVIHLDGRWQFKPQTVLVAGYQFRIVDYTGDELIGGEVVGNQVFNPVFSEDRNNRLHYGYVGVDQTFNPNLTGALRVGATYSDFYNSPEQTTSLSPYALLSLRYTYAPESTIEGGFSYDRNATDQIGFTIRNDRVDFTTDAESATVYASVSHRIMPKLYGGLTVQFQNSTYQGGSLDNRSDNYFLAGLSVEYRFTPHFSAHAGYNYDRLFAQDSDNDFDRNRVYLGVTASY